MKRHKKIIPLSIFFAGFAIQLLHAQSKIQGVVANEMGRPLSNVNVLLLHSKDSLLVKGTISDSNGSYQFTSINAGSYVLSFSYIGFKQTYTTPYIVNNNQHEILASETRLKSDPKLLNNVTTTAKKPLFEQKMDRMIVNVRNSITSAGSTALDVLERSPGVIVDRQNNGISMGGKDGVVVMINGKENRMPLSAIVQMLAGMPAGNIEKIELITTPPANFNAEGNAGVINIVLIENNNVGTNGSLTNSIGGGKNQMASTALNFNHRKGKFNIYGDYSYSITDMFQPFYNYRNIGTAGNIKRNETSSERDPLVKVFTGRTGIDIQISKKTTVGAIISGYINSWKMKSTSQTYLSTNQQLDTSISTVIHEFNPWKSISTNLNLFHILNTNENISVNLDYLYFHAENPVDYVNSYFNGTGDFLYNTEVKSSKLTPIRFWVASADYNKKIGKNIDLQAGVKTTFSGFTNDILITRLIQGAWVKDEGYSNSSELEEDIQAAYISINSKLGNKTTIKTGLRYEYTNSVLEGSSKQKIVDRHYGKLFPSLFILQKLNDNTSLNFSYSRRITRPTFNDLAPFTLFTDPNSFITGNPALQPSVSDILTAGFSYKSYIFSTAYTYDAGSIVRFQQKIDPILNKQFSSPENLNNLQTLFLILSMSVNPTKWWSMQYNITGRWQQSNSVYKGSLIIKDRKSYRVTSIQSFKLSKDFTAEISGYYQSSDLIGRNVRQSFGTLDVGLQKKIGKRGKLSLGVTDIFNSTMIRSYTDIPEYNQYLYRHLQFAQRMFKLTCVISFGNTGLREKRKRADSSEEERKRVE